MPAATRRGRQVTAFQAIALFLSFLLVAGIGGALLTPGSLALIEASFRPGDRVLHAVLGEGTVVSVEDRGIILIHFVNDGSERRLLANVAPLRKLGG